MNQTETWNEKAKKWLDSPRGAVTLLSLAKEAAFQAKSLRKAQEVDPKILKEQITI